MSFFDDIENNISSDSTERIGKEIYSKIIDDEINRLDKLCACECTVENIYNYFTSAEFHRRVGRLYADTQTPGVSQTVIRWEELESLLNVKLPTNHMENFAADYGDFIIYLHMDNSRYEDNDIHFNHYTYNDPSKNVMEFFDMKNDEKLIDYQEWKDRLDKKLILIFGYGSQLKPGMQEPLIFRGSHRGRVYLAKDGGSYELSLSNTESLDYLKV